jgi:hypothetical protein
VRWRSCLQHWRSQPLESSEIHCPGRNPPFLAVKRPARPHKSAIQTRVTMENAKGA